MTELYKCPNCGCTDLTVEVVATAVLHQGGDAPHTEIVSEHEWDDYSYMQCRRCRDRAFSISFRNAACPTKADAETMVKVGRIELETDVSKWAAWAERMKPVESIDVRGFATPAGERFNGFNWPKDEET